MLSTEQQLQQTQQSFLKLKDNFEHNLKVISELQTENDTLSKELEQACQQLNKREQLISRHLQQAASAQAHFANKLRSLESQHNHTLQQVSDVLTHRHLAEVNAIKQRHLDEIAGLKTNHQGDSLKASALQQENSRLKDSLQISNDKCSQLDQQVEQLQHQLKMHFDRLQLQQKEIEAIAQSNAQWEETLKIKIKDLQRQKADLEIAIADCQAKAKDKIKKTRENSQLAMQKLSQKQELDLMQINCQLKDALTFKTNKEHEIAALKKQITGLREQAHRQEMQATAKINSALQETKELKNQEFVIKGLESEVKRLQILMEDRTKTAEVLKSDLEDMNERRESSEKATERLKVQLSNKIKEHDNLVRQIRKLKRNQQQTQNVGVPTQQRDQYNFGAFNQPTERDHIFDPQASPKNDIEYSKAFTEDLGPIDQRFFLPDSIPNQPHASVPHPNPLHQLMAQSKLANPLLYKRMTELQLQNQQLKASLKAAQSSVESLRQIKDQQVRLGREEVNMLRQRIRSFQETNFDLRDRLNHLKQQRADDHSTLDQTKQLKVNLESLQTQNHQLRQQNQELMAQLAQVEEQLQLKRYECETVESIASQLRNELNSLCERSPLRIKQTTNDSIGLMQTTEARLDQHEPRFKKTHYYPRRQPISDKTQQDDNSASLIELQREIGSAEQSVARRTQPQQSKKLHTLIKERRALEVAGTRVTIANRDASNESKHARYLIEKTGTQSQKDVLQGLRRKSKSPQRGANYLELREDGRQMNQMVVQ